MTARMEKVRVALDLLLREARSIAYPGSVAWNERRRDVALAALADAKYEVEEWEAWVERLRSSVHEAHTVRAETAEARAEAAEAEADKWKRLADSAERGMTAAEAEADRLKAALTRVTEAGHRANISADCGCGVHPCPNVELIDALAAARALAPADRNTA